VLTITGQVSVTTGTWGEMLELLEKTASSKTRLSFDDRDNGRPFPRLQANLYDGGTGQPLAVRWRENSRLAKMRRLHHR